MSRIYSINYNGTLTNAGGDSDLLELAPADDKPIRLRGLILSQGSEVGDTAEEGLRITIQRLPATFTSGSGGAATAGGPLDETDTATGVTSEANNTTLATTSGTAVILDDFYWNIRSSPLERWWPDAAYAPMARQGSGLVIRSHTTPADDISLSITAYLEEQ